MNEIIVTDADAEVINMVNSRTAYRRRIAAEKAARTPALVFSHEATPAEVFEMRRAQLRRVTSAGAKLCLGLVFVGAMVRDLIDPVYALLVAGACVIWAVTDYRRGSPG